MPVYCRKIVSLLVTVCVLVSFAVPAAAKDSDISGHWASASIQKWVKDGLISGYSDGSYRPDNTVTKAELLVFIGKVLNYSDKSENKFNDVAAGAWYADCISRAAAADIIKADANGNISPMKAVTRQEAAVIIAKAFGLKTENTEILKNYTDSGHFSGEGRGAIAAMAEKGYIEGNPDKSFGYAKPVSRAEAVTMINNVMGTLEKAAGTYKGDIRGNLTVNTKNAVLKDMNINGDLYLAQGIGDGDVTLENVKVSGRTYVFGGGANTVKFINTKLGGSLILSKKDGSIRILAQGTTEIPEALLYSGGKLEEEKITGKGFSNVIIGQAAKFTNPILLAGDFSCVTANAADAGIQLIQGSIDSFDIDKSASDIKVLIEKDALINTVTANSSLSVSGQGTIANAIINALGVVIEQKPHNIKLAAGITSSVGGNTVGANPAAAVTPAAGGSSNVPLSPPSGGPDISPVPTAAPNPDHTPVPVKPAVLKAYAENYKIAKIEFNKDIDPATVTMFNIRLKYCRDYSLKLNSDRKTVSIIIKTKMPVNDEVTIENVRDTSGATVEKSVKTIQFTDNIIPVISGVTAENSRIIVISASEPIMLSKDMYEGLSGIMIDGAIAVAKVSSDYINNTLTLYLSSGLAAGAHKIKIADLEDFSMRRTIAAEFAFNVPSDTASPVMTEAAMNGIKELEVSFNEAVDSMGSFTVNGAPAAPSRVSGDFRRLKLALSSAISPDVTDIKISYKYQTDAVGNRVDMEKAFSLKAVNNTANPLVIAYIDRSNNIYLVFSKPMQPSGVISIMRSSSEIIRFPVIAGYFMPGTNNTVLEIGAAVNGLKTINQTSIMVNMEGLKDASYAYIELPEQNASLEAYDTMKPSAISNYLAKAGENPQEDTITFFFSEAMDKASLSNLDNYFFIGRQQLSKIVGAAVSSIAEDSKSITIKVPGIKAAADSQNATFGIGNLTDIAGNRMEYTVIVKIAVDLNVVSVTTIAKNKIEITFNTDIKMADPSVFKITKEGVGQAMVVDSSFDLNNRNKIILTVDPNAGADLNGSKLEFINTEFLKNVYDNTLPASTTVVIGDKAAPLAAVLLQQLPVQ